MAEYKYDSINVDKVWGGKWCNRLRDGQVIDICKLFPYAECRPRCVEYCDATSPQVASGDISNDLSSTNYSPCCVSQFLQCYVPVLVHLSLPLAVTYSYHYWLF